ncbi:hypothetical protein MUP01_04875 [Candidatus Bathyarchaeota archaeon]|nr:hypothetical protein [Candidatus Bathyarchaeota archaeon]
MAKTFQARCWCCAAQKTVSLLGDIAGRRAAEILQVKECREQACPKRNAANCFISKEVEARWL